MKYNEKYNRWVTKGGLVYRYDEKKDKLILCKLNTDKNGYLTVSVSKTKKSMRVHRLVWETFNGEIPQGYEIDHIKGNKEDNRLEMLRCVTHKDNMNNPLTIHKIQEVMSSEKLKRKISKANRGKVRTDFGIKFKEHYGLLPCEDQKLYHKEQTWYYRHNNKCRWEKEA